MTSGEIGGLPRRKLLAYVAVAGTVAMWALGPPMSKKVTGTPTTIVASRMWIAVPLSLLIQRASGSRPSLAKIRRCWMGALFMSLNMVLFFTVLKHVSIATITLVGVLQPIMVSLASVKLFGEKLSGWWVAWTTVAIGGVAVAVATAGKAVRATPFGLLLSVVTIAAFSCYMLASKVARKGMSSADYLVGVMIWSAIFMTGPVLIQGIRWHELDGADWAWILTILIGPGLIGHLLINWAITELPMAIISLQMLPTTIGSILLAVPMNHEHVTRGQALAGLVSIAAIGMIIRGPFGSKRRSSTEDLVLPIT
jgi:drug/metabolite transporter (DMT)-like permease